MKNKNWLWYLISIIIMIVLPLLTVNFVKGDNSMALCFILFYAINPIYSVIIGIVAGLHDKSVRDLPLGTAIKCQIQSLRILPLVTAILFLIGVIFIFDINEYMFSYYALGYMLIGYFCMAITAVIKEKRDKKS